MNFSYHSIHTHTHIVMQDYKCHHLQLVLVTPPMVYWVHPLATMPQSGYIIIWLIDPHLNSKGLPNKIYQGIGNILTKSLIYFSIIIMNIMKNTSKCSDQGLGLAISAICTSTSNVLQLTLNSAHNYFSCCNYLNIYRTHNYQHRSPQESLQIQSS